MSDRKTLNGGEVLDEIAAESGMAVVIVDERSRAVAASNNNSICQLLYASEEFAPRCAEFCGKAFEWTAEAGRAVDYECHAGLQCRTVPLKTSGKQFIAITGRTFIKAANYRNATSRAIGGDWRGFQPTRIFENVILSGSPGQLDRLEIQVAGLDRNIVAEIVKGGKNKPAAVEVDTASVPKPVQGEQQPDPFESSLLNYKSESPAVEGEARPDPFESSLMNFRSDVSPKVRSLDVADREAWRSFIGTLLQVPYKRACRRILEFLAKHYGIESSIWLQPEGKEFETAAAYGEFEQNPVRLGIAPDDKRVRLAVRDDSPIVLKERQPGATKNRRPIQLFPVVIGGEVRNALGVAAEEIDPELSSRITKFCRYVASRLEILRLREDIAERERLSRIMRDFSEQLRQVDADNFWQQLTSVSAELVRAERASLLVADHTGESLTAKASVGARTNLSFAIDLGTRVARTILEKRKPVLVVDVARLSLPPAPDDRKYKTSSFISYPITLGDRGIAVINFTDKIGGEQFDRQDIETLDSIAPQIAIAIDRMAERDKASEYAKLSITDPLTGLLNRRYIEERLTEEIKRSDRTGDPVSFMMIDVDEFKSYNDRFGHPAGDEALVTIGGLLKESLRGADIAARYGGEEFAVLLPQTSTHEAETIAERVRAGVEAADFPKRRITVSIGIASRSTEIVAVRELISAADKALYQAKAHGRNNVQIYRGGIDDAAENVH